MRIMSLIAIVVWSMFVEIDVSSANSVELRANGSNDTYGLINSVLAPGGNAIESPDCGHKKFGSHITQVFDQTLNQHIFRFHLHRDQDDDRCRKKDRQRVEIKVYRKSPSSLKAKNGDKFVFRWKFKLHQTFQPLRRFTHLHQLKAVGGTEQRMPLITLSARKGRNRNPDKFELNYAKHLKQSTIAQVDLKPFLGQWLEVTEHVQFGENGKYSVVIKSVKSGETKFEFRDEAIRMWKKGAHFIRPKWGIYRSLKDKINLKNEIVDFADIQISF